jgi:hypothetical protein
MDDWNWFQWIASYLCFRLFLLLLNGTQKLQLATTHYSYNIILQHLVARHLLFNTCHWFAVLRATRPSKTYLKISYLTQCVFLNLILKFLYIALHVSTDIDHQSSLANTRSPRHNATGRATQHHGIST